MLKITEHFNGEVRDLTSDGRGIIRHESGQVFFVDGVWPGETGEFCITAYKGRLGFADLVTLDVTSEDRTSAPCKFHGFTKSNCGGCPWQFMSYAAQLEVKQKKVASVLAKFIKLGTVKPIIPSEKTESYRNRAQLKSDGKKIGYMAPLSRELVPIDDCVVLTDKNRDTLKQIVKDLPKPEWAMSKAMQKKHHWTRIDIDETVDANSVSVNQRLPFKQANTLQNNIMQQWLIEKLGPFAKDQPILELFCGSGNFTQIISQQGFANINAVEIAGEALTSLKNKNLDGVTTIACDLFKESAFESVFRKAKDIEILILDPPREGLKNTNKLLSKKSKIKNIFYISCDLATFDRDVQFFTDQKFKLVELQPIDQFPHTPHIELMAHLQKK